MAPTNDRNDLDVLVVDIRIAKGTISLSHDTRPSGQHEPQSLRSQCRSPKAILKRLTAAIEQLRPRSRRKAYAQLEETATLVPSSPETKRRGSADSDQTLTNPVPEDLDGLLQILAPLVSALQKAALRVSALPDAPLDITINFEMACDKLLGLLGVVEMRVMDQAGAIDAHDLEMTALMIEALRNKVDVEKNKIAAIYMQPEVQELIDDEQEEEEEEIKVSQKDTESPAGPLVSQTNNPFILHSTSITLTSRRAATPGRGIPISRPSSSNVSPFVGGAQQTWARNIVRIGSFQNSALFSPSPIAVNKGRMFAKP